MVCTSAVHLDLVGPLPHSLPSIDSPAGQRPTHYSTVGGWGLHHWMDSALWNTVYDHDRPGITVWVSTVANVLQQSITPSLMVSWNASIDSWRHPWKRTQSQIAGWPHILSSCWASVLHSKKILGAQLASWCMTVPCDSKGSSSISLWVYRRLTKPRTQHSSRQLCEHRQTYVSNKLTTCTHVFVRHDAVWKPLQPPYNGPFLVLKQSPKFYTVDDKGK